ncbi:unnamed protein product [Closterium sp. NIES-64]|nr:unnamed protein product [Closterium sp. NIES-64]
MAFYCINQVEAEEVPGLFFENSQKPARDGILPIKWRQRSHQVEAEEVPGLFKTYYVPAVPCFLLVPPLCRPSPLSFPFVPPLCRPSPLSFPFVPPLCRPSPLSLPFVPPLCPSPLSFPFVPPLCRPSPLSLPFVPPLCPSPLSFPFVPPLCPSPLSLPFVLPLCPSPLSFPFVPPLCPSRLSFPFVLPLCSSPLCFPFVLPAYLLPLILLTLLPPPLPPYAQVEAEEVPELSETYSVSAVPVFTPLCPAPFFLPPSLSRSLSLCPTIPYSLPCQVEAEEVPELSEKHSVSAVEAEEVEAEEVPEVSEKYSVEAEEVPEVSEKYSVSAVPFFVFLKDGKAVDTLEGANPPELAHSHRDGKVVDRLDGKVVDKLEGANPPKLAHKDGKVVDRLEGANPPELAHKVALHVAAPSSATNFSAGGSAAAEVIKMLEGANPPELAHKVALHIAAPSSATNFSAGGSAAAEVIESVLHSARTAAYPAAAPPAASPAAAVAQPEQPSRMIAPPAGSDKPKLSPDLKARIEALLASHPVLLFMKGTPSAPRCGFSSKVVSVLEKDLGSAAAGAYGSFDILQDEEVRQGLKVYSDWPTFPQLYCKGELVGGCDIVLQMHESGELKEVFAEKGVLGGAGKGDAPGAVTAAAAAADGQVDGAKGLQERLKALLSSSPTMLFMKGTPEEPRCGFSRKVVDALQSDMDSSHVSFLLPHGLSSRPCLAFPGHTGVAAVWVQPQGGGCTHVRRYFLWQFDILTDEAEPRCGFSRKVVDAVKSDMDSSHVSPPLPPFFPPLFPPSSPPLPPLFPMACPHGLALLSQGTPEEPRCGFSRKVVDALTSEGISFGSFDILTDEAVRQGLKELSNWPTYPQVYHKGELIGGCDIVLEMKANGELKAELGG